MVRTWKIVKHNNHVEARFNISKIGTHHLVSPNPKDFEKYRDIMTDEFEFRKMFVNKESLKRYEDFLENN